MILDKFHAELDLQDYKDNCPYRLTDLLNVSKRNQSDMLTNMKIAAGEIMDIKDEPNWLNKIKRWKK